MKTRPGPELTTCGGIFFDKILECNEWPHLDQCVSRKILQHQQNVAKSKSPTKNLTDVTPKSDAHRSNIDALVVRHVTKDGEGDGARQQARGRVHQARDHRVPGQRGDYFQNIIFAPLT